MPDPPAVSRSPGEVRFVSSPREQPFPEEWYELTTPDHFWFQGRLAATLGLLREVGIPRDRPWRGLEIGGGTGVLRDQLEARTSWAIDMTDLNLEALRMAGRGRGENLYYDIMEERAPFLESYDVIILFDVLEHVEATGPFLRSILRHLKKGGYLLVNVPALQSLYGAYDRAAGHVRRYDKRSLGAEFARLDLELCGMRYWGVVLLPLLLARKLLLERGAGSAAVIRRGFRPPGELAHLLLRGLMRLESLWPRPPLGTSRLLAGRRSGMGDLAPAGG
jgi:2-polyprenyl-3-methyl-5-hydroxy-6-metoxy-1,4-benzoquinol methylase